MDIPFFAALRVEREGLYAVVVLKLFETVLV
jgi:hypothetical protein